MKVQQLLDLMGCVVSFEYETILGGDHVQSVKGLVTAISIELKEDHSISVLDFDDSENFYKIDRIKNFKAVQLDPYAFFDNIKNGTISLDI